MAFGAYQEFQAVCHGRPLVIVSTTGVAGPGAQDQVPAGRVYLALYSHDQQLVREFDFQGDRAEVRDQTVVQALLLLSDYFSAQRG
jgi:nicotinamide mononucleotide (NMN) deamidase PncC